MIGFLSRSADRPLVRCDQCPGRPVLPTHNPDVDSRRCVWCQGERRRLPLPHPEDHLCSVCARECPQCQAATDRMGLPCRACRGLCRHCSRPVPERSGPPAVTRVAPAQRKDRRRRWDKLTYARTWDQDLCDECRDTRNHQDPLRAVLSALPPKLLRACGGGVSHEVVSCIHDELACVPTAVLLARIDRRWWQSWAMRPLSREAEHGTEEAYRPDDVARWLIAPTDCPGRCEDGWVLAPPNHPELDDKPCLTCNTARPMALSENTPDPAAAADEDERETTGAVSDRTVAEAVAHRPLRECTGSDGACGVPVQPPHTQCPACLDWPWCGTCKRRRYDPERATRCTACTTTTTLTNAPRA